MVMFSVDFRYIFGGGGEGGNPLRDHFLRSKVAHGGSETMLLRFLMDVGLLWGSPGDHFGVILAPVSQNGAFMLMFRSFLGFL